MQYEEIVEQKTQMLLILKKLDRFNLLLTDSNFDEPDAGQSSCGSMDELEKDSGVQNDQLDYRSGEYFYEREKRRGPLFECEPEYPMSLRYHAYK